MTNKIMVVEDDVALRTVLERLLTDFGFAVVAVGDGAHVVEQVRAEQPNVILMDIQLPNRNGIELVRDIREIREFASLPIIMVTAKSEAEDMEEAFAAGADDWVEKSPWDQDKLMARIKNALRIQQRNNESLKPKEGDGLLRIGSVALDVVGHEVRKNGERVALTPLEFKLLGTLAATPNKVFSREDLLKDVWDYGYQADTRLVNVHIQRLRSKIEDDPDNPTIVVTVRGVGYKAGQN